MFSLSPALMLLSPKSVKRSRQLLAIDGRVDHRGRKVEHLKLKTWTNSSSSTYMIFFEFIQFLSYGASSSRQRKSNKQISAIWISFRQNKDQMRTNTKSLLIIRCSRTIPWHLCSLFFLQCMYTSMIHGSLFVAMIYSLVLRNEYYVLKVRSYENLENQKNQKNQKGRN